METGPRLKVSSDRPSKPEIESATSSLQGKRFIHYTTAASMWSACQTLEPEDQGQFPAEHLLFFFLACNAKLLHTSNMELYKRQQLHSLTFYIELSSKFVGVGLNLALLKDN